MRYGRFLNGPRGKAWCCQMPAIMTGLLHHVVDCRNVPHRTAVLRCHFRYYAIFQNSEDAFCTIYETAIYSVRIATVVWPF
jgi:hypothetical protein